MHGLLDWNNSRTRAEFQESELGGKGRAGSPIVVVGENILPPYVANDRSTYVAAVRLFYDEVLKTADEAGELPDDVRGLIQRVAQYGSDGDYEYKTDLTTFLEFVTSAGLSVAEVKKVWPESGKLCLTTGGNYVFILQAAR
jgi:hypothetical protein